MVKVPPAQIENIFKNLNKYKGLLIYGPDYGLVQSRAEISIKYFFPEAIDNFRFFDFTIDELKDNEEKLLSSIKSISFSKGRKVIRIKGSNSFPSFIKDAIKEISSNEFILLIADDLPSSNTLRKYFEDNQEFLAVACYKPDNLKIKSTLINFFRENKITVDGDITEIISYLENIFSLDSMIMNSELEKIASIAANQKINLNIIQEIVGTSLDIKIEELIFAIMDYRIRDALKYYENVIDEISEVGLVRYMINFLNKISDIKIHSQRNNISINDTIKAQRPPIFFKLVPHYLKYSSNLTLDQLRKFMEKLNQAELLAKSNNNISVIFKNYILSIAKV